jgi:adenylate cyclase
VIVPEAEFLSEIDQVIARVGLGLVAFVLVAGGIGALAVRQLVAKPVSSLAEDLGHIERFELESVRRRPSRLHEIDRLSDAIVRMSAGLADFGKFIPADLVRSLLVDGMRAEPGGTRRTITILFSDLAGFTALSERLGDAVVPLVSAALDLTARAVSEHHGTVDKFIGDSVMAFWGAPKDDPDHVLNACRAVLAASAAFQAFRASSADAAGLDMRFGLNSGSAIVGNVGSASRLNYTALGDSVNLASRLEGVNKIYGTSILIGESVRTAAGDAIVVREVDTVAVYGRAQGVRIFELLGLAGDGPAPAWVEAYEAALAAYREGDFAAAIGHLEALARHKPGDGPGERLASRCRELLAAPLPTDWAPVTILGMK